MFLLNCIPSVSGAAPQSVFDKTIKKQRDIKSTSLSIASYYASAGAKLFQIPKLLSVLPQLANNIYQNSAQVNLITSSMARGNNNSSNNNIIKKRKKFQQIINNKKNIKTDINQGNTIGYNTGFGSQINFNNNLQSNLSNSWINSSNSKNNAKNASGKKTKLIEDLKNKLAASQGDFYFKTKLSEMLSANYADGSLYELEGSDLLNNALESALIAVEEAGTNNDINSTSIEEAVKVFTALLDEKNMQENTSDQDSSNSTNQEPADKEATNKESTNQEDDKKDTDKNEDKKSELMEKIDEVLTWSDRIAKAETAIKQLTGVIDFLRGQNSMWQNGMGQSQTPPMQAPPLQPITLPTPVVIPTPVIPTSTSIPPIPSSFSLQANANLNVTPSSGAGNNKNKKTANAGVNTAKDSFVQTDNNTSVTAPNISSNNISAHHSNNYTANYPIVNSSEKLSLRPAFNSNGTHNGIFSGGTFAKLPPVPPYGLGTPLNNGSFGPAHTPAAHGSRHNSVRNSRHASGHGSLLSTPASNNITSNQLFNSQSNLLTGIGSAYTNNNLNTSRFEPNAGSNNTGSNNTNLNAIPSAITDFGVMRKSENTSASTSAHTSANTTPSNNDGVDPIIEFIDTANSNSNNFNSADFNAGSFIPPDLIPPALISNNMLGNNMLGNNMLGNNNLNNISSGFGKVSNVGGISGKRNQVNGLNTLGGNTLGGGIRSGNIISGGGLGGHGTVIRPRIVGAKGPAFPSLQSFANSNSNPAIKNTLLNRILGNQVMNSNMVTNNTTASNSMQSGMQSNLLRSHTDESIQPQAGHRPSVVQFNTLLNTIVPPKHQDSSDDTSSHGPISRENTEERLGSDNPGSDDNLGGLTFNTGENLGCSYAMNSSVVTSPNSSSVQSKGPAFIPKSQKIYSPGVGNIGNQNGSVNKQPDGKSVRKIIKGSKGPVF